MKWRRSSHRAGQAGNAVGGVHWRADGVTKNVAKWQTEVTNEMRFQWKKRWVTKGILLIITRMVIKICSIHPEARAASWVNSEVGRCSGVNA